MKREYTEREALSAEADHGGSFINHKLRWAKVTTFGCEPRYILMTERCDYCGQPVATVQCRFCGAGPRVGH